VGPDHGGHHRRHGHRREGLRAQRDRQAAHRRDRPAGPAGDTGGAAASGARVHPDDPRRGSLAARRRSAAARCTPMTAVAVDVTQPLPRSRTGVAYWLSAAFLVLLIGCGLLAPWIAPHDPTDADL